MTTNDAARVRTEREHPHPGDQRMHAAVRAPGRRDDCLPRPEGLGIPPVPPLSTACGHPDEPPGRHPLEVLIHEGDPEQTSIRARRYARRCCRASGVTTLLIIGVDGLFLERFSDAEIAPPELPEEDIARDSIHLARWIRRHSDRTIVVPSRRLPITEALRGEVPLTVLCDGRARQTIGTYRAIRRIQESCRKAGHELPSLRLIGVLEPRSDESTDLMPEAAMRIIGDLDDFLGIRVHSLSYVIEESRPLPIESRHVAHRWDEIAEDGTYAAHGRASCRELLEELSAPDGPLPFPGHTPSR